MMLLLSSRNPFARAIASRYSVVNSNLYVLKDWHRFNTMTSIIAATVPYETNKTSAKSLLAHEMATSFYPRNNGYSIGSSLILLAMTSSMSPRNEIVCLPNVLTHDSNQTPFFNECNSAASYEAAACSNQRGEQIKEEQNRERLEIEETEGSGRDNSNREGSYRDGETKLADEERRGTTYQQHQEYDDIETDPHRLVSRFVRTQKVMYSRALDEIQNGQKQGHWSWYIFPTPPYLEGGVEAGSLTNIYYSLRTDEQAIAYLRLQPVDGIHLRANYIGFMKAISEQLKTKPDLTLAELIGPVDEPKLLSSLGYFLFISKKIHDEEVHEICSKTLRIIHECDSRPGPWRRWMNKIKERWMSY